MKHHNQSGLAILAALSLMIIASSAAAVLTWHFAHEGARTRRTTEQTQLHQLLTAGTMHALLWVDRPRINEAGVSINLPAMLAARPASLRLKLIPQPRSLERHIQASAQIDDVAMSQTLRFVKTRTGWALAEATLDR